MTAFSNGSRRKDTSGTRPKPRGGGFSRELRDRFGVVGSSFETGPVYDSRDPAQVDAVRTALATVATTILTRQDRKRRAGDDKQPSPPDVAIATEGGSLGVVVDALGLWGSPGQIERPVSRAGLTGHRDRRVDYSTELALQGRGDRVSASDHVVLADFGLNALGLALRKSDLVRDRFGAGIDLTGLDSTAERTVSSIPRAERPTRPVRIVREDFLASVSGSLDAVVPDGLGLTDVSRISTVARRAGQLWTSVNSAERARNLQENFPRDSAGRETDSIVGIAVLHEDRSRGGVPDQTLGLVIDAVRGASNLAGLDFGYHDSLASRQEPRYETPFL